MTSRFDPRGDLPAPYMQTTIYDRPRSSLLMNQPRHTTNRFSSFSISSKPRVRTCHDWIFSSASTVHVAIDRELFKEYTPFESYVLTLSDHRQVLVEGIGSIELKIRRKPGSRDSHTILLNDVLHLPTWPCNIFSDVYFELGHDYQHSWTSSGLQMSKKEGHKIKAWGYTESFCSLDRLVLAKYPKDSKSPMLEDKEREIFSINVRWPQSQRDRWEAYLEKIHRQLLSEAGSLVVRNAVIQEPEVSKRTGTIYRRATLSNMNANIVNRATSKRVSSLRATTSGLNLSKAAL